VSLISRTLAILVVFGAASAVSAAGYPEFLVSYWCGPPAAETTLQRYKEIADCGFNVAFVPIDGKGDVEANLKILELCQAVGIKALIHDNRMGELFDEKRGFKTSQQLKKTLDAIVAQYSSHPALAGYHVCDEPNARMFPVLGAINQYLLKKDPKHPPFINLFPNYATPAQLGNKTYKEHVAQYIATVKPALVCYDHYQQMFGREDAYFANLEVVRALCLEARLPFAQIVLTIPHFGYRNPSEADMRWQIYTSVAYGARGILYFTYWYWNWKDAAQGPAIINAEGKPDVKYEILRRLNGRLKALGPLLMQMQSTGVYHTAPLPPGTRPLAADAPVRQAAGGQMVIGCFKTTNMDRYVLVVNKTFNERFVAKLTLDKKTVAASEISQETGKPLEATALKERTLEVPLEAGEGKLFLLNPK
jgi:hypothetical protein